MNGVTIERLARELCDKSGCHHKCHDTKDCVVEEEALLLINENKSNNFDVKSNKVVKSTDWLTKGYNEEELERMKAEAIKEAEEEIRNNEIEEMAKVIAKADDIFAELEKKFVPDTNVGHKTEREDK